jgi:hypothetical protein
VSEHSSLSEAILSVDVDVAAGHCSWPCICFKSDGGDLVVAVSWLFGL